MKTYTLYKIKQKVFAIARYYVDKKESSYLMILEARVNAVYISYNKETNKEEISYMLECPDGVMWGQEVPAIDVDSHFLNLVTIVQKEWKTQANTH